MRLDYEELVDEGQQLSAELDGRLERCPDDGDLKRTQGILADRQEALLLLMELDGA